MVAETGSKPETSTIQILAERLYDGAVKIGAARKELEGRTDQKRTGQVFQAQVKWLSLETEWREQVNRGVFACPLSAHNTDCLSVGLGVWCAFCQIKLDELDYQDRLQKTWQEPLHACTDHKIFWGNCLEVLDAIPEGSVQMVMTSPPYWQLKDYRAAPESQIGLEDTHALYIQKLVVVFRKVRRVLKDDGVCFIVMGDKWQDKQKLCLPARLALALQEDGWTLRNNIVWAKFTIPAKPEQLFSNVYEEVIFISAKPEHYFDTENIQVPTSQEYKKVSEELAMRFQAPMFPGIPAIERPVSDDPVERSHDRMRGFNVRKAILSQPKQGAIGFKVPPNLWYIPLENRVAAGYARWVCTSCQFSRPIAALDKRCPECNKEMESLGHPAAYPEELCVLPILAGSKPGDIILDPFAGSGTTGVVAKMLGRQSYLIELFRPYAEMAAQRVDAIPNNMLTGA